MLVYIIDGFNLAHKIPSIKKSASPQRDLIQYIYLHKLTGSNNNKVIIVFDGYMPAMFQSECQFEIIYSGQKTADDVIKQRLDNLKNRSQIIVVTDDREIRDYVKQKCAVSVRVGEFLKEKKIAKPENRKDISYVLQKEITDELRKVWLKEN